MLIRRTIRLILAAFLAVTLGLLAVVDSATVTRDQGLVGVAQTAFTATPSQDDCSQCDDCAKPCTASIVCSAASISGLVPAVLGPALKIHRRHFAGQPDWQLSSAHQQTPTPPPRRIHLF